MAIGTMVFGSMAIGTMVIGAMAIGTMAIGTMSIGWPDCCRILRKVQTAKTVADSHIIVQLWRHFPAVTNYKQYYRKAPATQGLSNIRTQVNLYLWSPCTFKSLNQHSMRMFVTY